MKIIIADSSTLIALLDTNNFYLLFELFEELIITPEVYNEITYNNLHTQTIKKYLSSTQLTIKPIKHSEMYEMLRKRLDIGESSSIVLAKTLQLSLIIDEKKGRKVAKSLGINIIGLVGILLKLLQKNIITKKRALEIVKDLEKNNFRLSDELKSLIYSFIKTL